MAIVDLLPGGFEFAAGSLEPGAGSRGFDFVEVREDRAVFFGTVGPQVREVTLPDQADEPRRIRRAAGLCGIDVRPHDQGARLASRVTVTP